MEWLRIPLKAPQQFNCIIHAMENICELLYFERKLCALKSNLRSILVKHPPGSLSISLALLLEIFNNVSDWYEQGTVQLSHYYLFLQITCTLILSILVLLALLVPHFNHQTLAYSWTLHNCAIASSNTYMYALHVVTPLWWTSLFYYIQRLHHYAMENSIDLYHL